MREDSISQISDFSDPIKYWKELRDHYAEKANHNKLETNAVVGIAIGSAIFAGMMSSLGEGFWLGKVTPTSLNAIVIGCLMWLRTRQPHKLWNLYRSTQRSLESEKFRYDNNLTEPRDQPEKALENFILSIDRIQASTHMLWSETLPEPKSFTRLLQNEEPQKDSSADEGKGDISSTK